MNGIPPHLPESIRGPFTFGVSLDSRVSGRVGSQPAHTRRVHVRNRKHFRKRNSLIQGGPNSVARSAAYDNRKLKSQIEQLRGLYRFSDGAEVAKYLQANPALFKLLKEAHPKILEYFGSVPEVVLEVFVDYEAPSQRELMALVQTPLPPSEALDCLDRLYREWWAEASATVPHRMSIDVESL